MTTVDIETMTRQYKQMVALKGADVPNHNKSKGQKDNRPGWRLQRGQQKPKMGENYTLQLKSCGIVHSYKGS